MHVEKKIDKSRLTFKMQIKLLFHHRVKTVLAAPEINGHSWTAASLIFSGRFFIYIWPGMSGTRVTRPAASQILTHHVITCNTLFNLIANLSWYFNILLIIIIIFELLNMVTYRRQQRYTGHYGCFDYFITPR